ncbi:MAG: thiosulfate oxidation carrier complex protein SoxZ [Phreatobacter sp.]|nr:thiosulfate oxidation carrier complex protein SoxZ [Phreatobacter sp.]
MSTRPTPRVRVPGNIKAGDIVEVKTLISHEMESGQRRGQDGKPIPRKIINRFTATFNGKPVFDADWHAAISANPYQSFFFKPSENGELKMVWKDDDGAEYTATSRITVS